MEIWQTKAAEHRVRKQPDAINAITSTRTEMFRFFLGSGQDCGSVGKLGLLSNSVAVVEFYAPQDSERWLSRD